LKPQLNYSFQNLINQVDALKKSAISNEIKLKRSGSLIYQSSLGILDRAREYLDILLTPETTKEDTKIDSSFNQFLASITQQSISTNFLHKYLRPVQKTKYKRETTVEIKSLKPSEALAQFERDLIEVISLAHDENIDDWIALVTEYLARRSPISLEEEIGECDSQIKSLSEIVGATCLSQAQVFITLLFGNFTLIQQGDFYEGDSIKAKINP
jgi:hypothetical protein